MKKDRKVELTMKKKQTAGKDVLGKFAPKFAELNDDCECTRCCRKFYSWCFQGGRKEIKIQL